MQRFRQAFPFVVVAVCLSSASVLSRQTPSLPSGLKIVVIGGEDAVNIIQQKTAVAPIVEVRDHNDQPVAGAIVNFAIRGGRATFGGARTLTVATDVAGRAVAAGFTPTASGAVQISATAAFQGQTAAAITITQTNVLTAAQAAAVSSAGSSGGTASGTGAGAGAGGGGGLSATTIGIIGGAVAGGALVGMIAVSGDAATPQPTSTTYTGPLTGQLVDSFTTFFPNRTATCVETRAISGTLSMMLKQQSDGTITGSAVTRPVETVVSVVGCNPTIVLGLMTSVNWNLPVSGTTQNLAFGGQTVFTPQNLISGGTIARSMALTFSGTLVAGVVSGTMTITRMGQGSTEADTINPASPVIESGSTTLSVSLR